MNLNLVAVFHLLILVVVSIPIRDLMNLNPSSFSTYSRARRVSIPIRDLMNLNLTNFMTILSRSLVSIPIRDLMNLNLCLIQLIRVYRLSFQSLLGI